MEPSETTTDRALSRQSASVEDGRERQTEILRVLRDLREEVRELRSPAAESPPEMYEVETVAEILSVSERTVRSLISEGALPSVKVRRCRRVPREGLQLFIEERLSDWRNCQGGGRQ